MPIHNTELMFMVMVFIAVFLLAQSLIIPSADRRTAKRMRRRMSAVAELYKENASVSVLKEKYRREHSFLERWLDLLPGMSALNRLIEQSGRTRLTIGRFLLISGGLAVMVWTGVWIIGRDMLLGSLAGAFAGILPFFKIQMERSKRLDRFEEQLPEALEIMIRALRAGYPFNETLRIVADEMDDPIRKEMETTFSDINYGMDTRIAFLGLLQRAPSMSLLSLVTAVLIQRDTGGNLTEVLEKISHVIRGRFRFQRRVRTLSAEARLSAWILTLLPFVLVVAISLTSPDYLPMLIKDPAGIKLVAIAFVMMILGVLWIRRLIAKVMEI
jgi:tight adherence protein B